VLGHPYTKGVGEMLLRQWGIICCLTIMREGVTSETATGGNKSLFGVTSCWPLSLPHLPRCPSVTGMWLWSWRVRGKWMLVKVHPCRSGCPRLVSLLPVLLHQQSVKKRRAVVIGDSLLRGTEGLICLSDPSHREVCCLPGAQVRDVAKNITVLDKPSDYYPLLVFCIGNKEVGKRSPWAIKRDFRALGRLLKGLGVQVVFSSVLSVGDWDLRKRRRVDMLNEWLCKWCRTQGFGYYGLGRNLEKGRMLAAN